MSDNFYPSMASHTHFVPANFEPAYARAQPIKPAASPRMSIAFERKFVAKRGRSSDADMSNAFDSFGDHQRCVYLRKTVMFTGPKRIKAVQSEV
ncbi:hypothetical protein EC988_000414 [Linderina pennispora]|nr:hypothetical protein EC988_000414 [Linderina pennispora]